MQLLTPIRVPPNCAFEVDDFENEWLYQKPFDYIHGREIEGCVGNENRLFSQAFQHLKPGGYVEVQCVSSHFLSDDDTAAKAENCQLWIKTLREGGEKFGKSYDSVKLWKGVMEEVGFVDVKEAVYKVSRPIIHGHIHGLTRYSCPLVHGRRIHT